tara:strand:- start:5654 stop:6127 length:474 start_codon:yes stop_codon:yes gene_type:complete
MNIRHSASIALWSTIVFSTNVIAKDIAIYRWVDENDVVHFSQHQPQNSNYSQLTTFASYQARGVALPKSAQTPSVDEQLSQYKKDKAEVLAKNAEIAEKNCKAAQLNEKMLNSFNKVMITDANGKNSVMSNKEKKAQLALNKEHISLYCKKENEKDS